MSDNESIDDVVEITVVETTEPTSEPSPSPSNASINGTLSAQPADSRTSSTSRVLVCYVCGRQFGSTSLSIHLRTCPTKRDAIFKTHHIPPQFIRPVGSPPISPMPKEDSPLTDFKRYNDEALDIFKQSMCTCPGCSRRFDPEAFSKHLKHCKEVPKSALTMGPSVRETRPTSIPLVCYLCGLEYGSASLHIHLRTCASKREALMRSSGVPAHMIPPAGKSPSNPVPSDGALLSEYEAYNREATQIYKESLCTCPGCGKKFELEPFARHIKHCDVPLEMLNPIVRRSNILPVVCHVCGNKYGLASLLIHLKTCPSKRVALLQASRVPTHLHPTPPPLPTSPFPTETSPITEFEEYNAEATNIYRESLCKCPGCTIRLEPEAFGNHLKMCRDYLGMESDKNRDKEISTTHYVCYVCGLEYGSASIQIHLKTCSTKRANAMTAAGVPSHHIKPVGPGPSRPLPKEGSASRDIREYNDEAYAIFRESMCECPGCKKKMDPEPFVRHLKTCRSLTPTKLRESEPQRKVSVSTGVTCFICGQTFGTDSLPFHLLSCATKREANMRASNVPAQLIRPIGNPPKASFPSTGASSSTSDFESYNAEALSIYRESMCTCPGCQRKFDPDPFVRHIRICKDVEPAFLLKIDAENEAKEAAAAAAALAEVQGSMRTKRSSSSMRRSTGPMSLMCHVCGNKYGSASLAIHVKTCPTRRDAVLEASQVPSHLRPPPPGTPSLRIPDDGATGEEIEIYNTEAQRLYRESMCTCPGCSKKFDPDPFLRHLSSCKEVSSDVLSPPTARRQSGDAPTTQVVPLVCHICGMKYGSKSLPIHLKACSTKRENIMKSAGVPMHLIPASPSSPDLPVPDERDTGAAFAAYNRSAWSLYKASMCTCPGCGRKFEPEPFVKHLKVCKDVVEDQFVIGEKLMRSITPGRRASQLAAGFSSGSADFTATSGSGGSLSSGPTAGGKLVTCHVCGNDFSVASLFIHLRSCPDKRDANMRSANVPLHFIRPVGYPPTCPFPGEGSPASDFDRYNLEARVIFQDSMCKCPGCARRFDPEPFTKHLSICKEISGDPFHPNFELPAEDKAKAILAKRTTQPGVLSLLCHVCGLEYGTTSYPIHMKNCATKRELSMIVSGVPPQHIRPIGQPPALPVPTDKSPASDIRAFNDEARAIYRESMCTCPGCQRKFDPDPFIKHLKICKDINPDMQQRDVSSGRAKSPRHATPGRSSAARSKTPTPLAVDPGSSTTSLRGLSKVLDEFYAASPSHRRSSSVGPTSITLACHICGNEFGSASLSIHLRSCAAKRTAAIDSAQIPKEFVRPIGRAPSIPIPSAGDPLSTFRAYNDEASEIFRESMCTCPHCTRKFDFDAFAKHIKTCGEMAKRERREAPPARY